MKKLLLFCCLFVTTAVQGQPLLKTHVETGDLEGVLDGNDLAVYKAIPYAAPPVGDLRWKEPQPAKAWEGVLKAENFGPLPPQPTRPGRTADMMSEDCLYLGIATPASSVNDNLPVMVWIHDRQYRISHGRFGFHGPSRTGKGVKGRPYGQLRPARPNICPEMGAAQHPQLWRRSIEGNHLW